MKTKNVIRRERSNADRDIRAYKFHCEPQDLPEWIEQVAIEMRNCWNALAYELKQAVKPFIEKEKAIAELPKEEQKAAYAQLNKERLEVIKSLRDIKHIRAVVRELAKGKISSDLYESVVAKWQTALGEWPKRRRLAKQNGKKVTFITGMPRIKYKDAELEINLPVTFNRNKGDEVVFASLYNDSGKISIQRYPNTLGVNTKFKIVTPRNISLKPINLNVAYHRLPPMDAFVKKVNLIKNESNWNLIYTTEVVPVERNNRIATGRVAGWNSIGWRLFPDRIRIGMLADNGGNFYEFSVPLSLINRKNKRTAEFIKNKGGDYVTNWFDLDTLSKQIGDLIQTTKDSVKKQYETESDRWPDVAKEMLPHLTKMRDKGLSKLYELLKYSQTEAEITLKLWQEDILILRKRYKRFSKTAISSRNDAYKKLAHWLSTNFDKIGMTNNELKSLAEQSEQTYVQKNAQQQRQIVGQSFLQTAVNHSAHKFGTELVELPEDYVCACGAKIERDAKLVGICENGHKRDIDVSAAEWALRRINDASTYYSAVEIPADLRRYVKLVAASDVFIAVAATR
jgi:hypothetical protein